MTPEPLSSTFFLPVAPMAVVLGGLTASTETTAGATLAAIASKRSLRACKGSAPAGAASGARDWALIGNRVIEPPKKIARPRLKATAVRFMRKTLRGGWPLAACDRRPSLHGGVSPVRRNDVVSRSERRFCPAADGGHSILDALPRKL